MHSKLRYPLEGKDLSTVPEPEILCAIKEGLVISQKGADIVRITSTAVVKKSVEDLQQEAWNMDYVFRHSNGQIRVPRVHRHFHHGRFGYLVMDFIDENSLDAIPWAERTVQQRQHIIAQAAKGLAWMRTMRSSIPGPVGGGIPTGGLFTLYGAGRTFQTATDMEPWFNHKLNIRGTGDVTGMFDELSMCHMDLSLRNLVLDKAGELWFLDWAFAGFFPPSFEYASLLHKQPDSPDYEFVQGVLKELRPVPYDETLVALLLRVFQVNDGPFQGSHIIAGL